MTGISNIAIFILFSTCINAQEETNCNTDCEKDLQKLQRQVKKLRKDVNELKVLGNAVIPQGIINEDAGHKSCPKHFHENAKLGTCYYIADSSKLMLMDRASAATYCASRGANLIAIETPEEQDYLRGFVFQRGLTNWPFWTSFNAENGEEEPVFEWLGGPAGPTKDVGEYMDFDGKSAEILGMVYQGKLMVPEFRCAIWDTDKLDEDGNSIKTNNWKLQNCFSKIAVPGCEVHI
ncbi:unnamed protein product [Owenia fusiformis]|uniref:C-type lectin domain-containing protein n=1 Tax=Owenia fusiformis TaxID=6347 RepID=A0A8S4PI06_OWEFU|nr:unnamed protein product [Owenia fusiformis]